MCGFRGGTGGLERLENHKIIGFPSNTGPDSLENHLATKTANNIVGPSSAAIDCSILVVSRSSLLSSIIKIVSELSWTPSDKLSGSFMVYNHFKSPISMRLTFFKAKRKGKGLTFWLSFVMSNCEFTFSLVSVRCGT